MNKWQNGILFPVISGIILLVIGNVVNQKENIADKNAIKIVTKREINPNYLAELVGKEAFTEKLPSNLNALGFADVNIADPSATNKLKAVQLEIMPNTNVYTSDDVRIFAHIEIYKTPKEAQDRAETQMHDLAKRYDDYNTLINNGNTFCLSANIGDGAWICGGYRQFAYVEVSLSPAPNAYLSMATGTVSALLKYTDKMTALATN